MTDIFLYYNIMTYVFLSLFYYIYLISINTITGNNILRLYKWVILPGYKFILCQEPYHLQIGVTLVALE